MKAYHNSVVLRNDGQDTATGKFDLNAGVTKQVTVRINSSQALAIVYDLNEVQIANPVTTDSNGNYKFKANDDIYDVIISEGGPDEYKIEKVEIVQVSSLIDDLSQSYELPTVAAMTASTIVFPVGKRITVTENTGTYTVLSGTGIANALNIKASSSVSQSFSLKPTDDGKTNSVDAGLIADGVTDQKANTETVTASMGNDLIIPLSASEFKLSAAPNIGAKTVHMSKFDQVDPLILADMQAMVSEKGYRGGTPQATQFKKWGLDVISGIVRKVAEGTDKWKFISNAQGDADHETIGFDNTIEYTADATSLTLPLNLLTTPTSEVLSVICAPDETLAVYGLTVGASVGTSQLQLQMSFDNKFGRSFRYDGAPNFVMTTIYGSIYAVSFSIISPNVMRVVFPRMVAPKIVMTPAGTGIPHYPTVKSFNNAYTMDIKFLDLVAGTLNPSLSAQHDFNLYMEDRTVMQLNGSTGGAPSDVGDKILTTGTSNIWIYGIQKAIG